MSDERVDQVPKCPDLTPTHRRIDRQASSITSKKYDDSIASVGNGNTMMRQRRQEASGEYSFVLIDQDVESNGVGNGRTTAAIDEDKLCVPTQQNLLWRKRTKRRIRILIILVVVVSAAYVLYIKILLPRGDRVVYYTCPARVTKSMNDIPTENQEYERVTNKIKTNLTEYMQTFRNSSFDSWGRTYDRVKRGMYPWKKAKFAPHLNNGDSIYESACGIGMNLYMTLEILNEIKNIETLVVYGNEYVALSAEVANAVFDENPPFGARKGTICPGDSANIDFVPSNSFDLVYTGYIT